MAQLDRLLSVMVSQRASALRLDESQLAELDIAGAPRPVTKTPLTGPQVLALVREVAPADAAAALDAGQGADFSYLSDDGAFIVRGDGVILSSGTSPRVRPWPRSCAGWPRPRRCCTATRPRPARCSPRTRAP